MLSWENSLAMASQSVAGVISPFIIVATVGSRLTTSERRITVSVGYVLLAIAMTWLGLYAFSVSTNWMAHDLYGPRPAILEVTLASLAGLTAVLAGRQWWMKKVPVIAAIACGLFWFINSWDCGNIKIFDANERCGVPFNAWQHGNFAGYGAGILWFGLLGNLAVGALCAASLHWVVRFFGSGTK